MSINALLSQRWQFCHQPLTWRNAIHLASQPLISEHKINAHYPLHIIDALKQEGSAFLADKGTLIVHARPEQGVVSQQGEAAVLKCEKPVVLPDGNKVSMIIVISAGDLQAQQQIRQQVISWLGEKQRGERFLQSTSQPMLNKQMKADLNAVH